MIRSYQGITPVIPTSCYIDPSAQVIGDVILGEQASIWMNAVVRGDVNSIRIGSKSNVQDCAVLHGMRYLYPVIVGEMVTIGHNATVHGCVLEDAVLVGIGATILRCRTRISRRKESVGERFVGGREMVATRRTTVRDGDGGETCGSLEARL